jgi:hypothetical protein
MEIVRQPLGDTRLWISVVKMHRTTNSRRASASFLTHPKIIDGVVHSGNGLVAQASRLPPVSAEDREVWASEVTSIDALHKITHQDSL